MRIDNSLTGHIHIDNSTWFPFPSIKLQADLYVNESKIVWEKDTKSIDFTIKNKGNKDSESFYVTIKYQVVNKASKFLIRFYISKLEAHKTIRKSFNLMSLSNNNNNYLKDIEKLIIKVDDSNKIKESNEKNNIEIIKIDSPIKELVLDDTRQILITKTDDSEKIELLSNGEPYAFNCKSGDYEGCGIDAAHAFMGWLNDIIPRSTIKRHIKTTNLTDTIFGDIKDGDTFTTPAQMSRGLAELVHAIEPEYKVIRHSKDDNAFIIKKIHEYLQSAMPVTALINNGNHWITIVGMDCKYSGNKLDLNSLIKCIDLTSGSTYSTSYSNLKICGWSSPAESVASSYVAGTIVSIENSSVCDSYTKKAYKVEIHTSDLENAGTDANILLTITSTKRESLTYKIDTICNDFEKRSNTIQSFIVDDYLDDIKSISVSRDNSGKNSGWNINYIKISESTTDRDFIIPIYAWIDPVHNNTYLVNDNTRLYEIEIETGDVKNAGTDAKVYIKLYGENGESSYIQLDNNENNYEKNKTDYFNLEYKDLGAITKIKIKHNNSGRKAGWFLEKVLIKKDRETYSFTAQQWLSGTNTGSLPEITLINDLDRIIYSINVKTSNVKNAGTDAAVYIKLYGTNGKSTPLQRIDIKSVDDFEKGSLGQYLVYADEELGEIKKIKLEHDNTKDGSGWKISDITINNQYTFNINEWLESSNESVHPNKIFTR